MTSDAALPTLRTPRLTLRPLRADDAPALAEGVGNYDVARWLGQVPYPYKVSDAEAFLAEHRDARTRVWGICDRYGLQGVISYTDELGYWLARPAWGLGYATEAGDAVVDHVFRTTDLTKLISGHYMDNSRSARVLKKMGFTPDGRRDVTSRALVQTVVSQVMVLSRERWRERRDFHVKTERLILRGIDPADWRDMQRLAGVPDVAPMLLSVTVPWPEEAVRRWIAASLYRGRPGFRAVITLPDSTAIGGVGLGRAGGSGPMTVMYWLGRAFWGQGFATEALSGFLRACYERFPEIDEIEADHFTDNAASGRVLDKLGFKRIGHGTADSAARLEPAPVILYRVSRDSFKASP